jgi:hypothetical protein
MNQVSSERASDAEGQVNLRQRIRGLLLDRHIRVGAAILMLAGGFNVTSSAFAQAPQDAASCIANCKAQEPKCKDDGSSEELCEYDSKQCQKACGESK